MGTQDEFLEKISKYVEQPEPSTKGMWYVVPLEQLAEDYKYIEFHFEHDLNLTYARFSNDEDHV